jgi:uncharacterized protein (TIGR02246 family)
MERSKQATAMCRPEGSTAPGIDALMQAWARAWNAHDMQALAMLVDAGVDFVTVAGHWLSGRDEFLRHHQDIHRRHMRETTWATVGYALRPLRDDLVLVHQEWTITGECDSDGTLRPPRSGIFTWVVACTAGAWLIAAAHNTNLRADTSHRLTGRGKS